MNRYFIWTFWLVILLTTCTTSESQKEKDLAIIQEYIANKNLTNVQSSSTGLHYIIQNAGAGLAPTDASVVTIKYWGKLTNDILFDSSDSLPDKVFKTRLNTLITAWREGLPKIKSGGQIKLLVPSSLGYGDRSLDKIPANSVLIFDIELLKVEI